MIVLRAPLRVGTTTAVLALLLVGCREEPVRTYRTAKEPPPVAAADPHAGHDHGENAPLMSAADLPPGHPAIGAAAAAAPAAADTATTVDSLTWAAPDHWVAKPLGAMRRGSFTARNDAGEADCSVFVFPAATNPLLENINRWRRQIGLTDLTSAQLPTETAAVENAGLSFTTVDLTGTSPSGAPPTRVLGAVLYRGDEAWFFKLSGPAPVVAAERSAFLAFLHTVRPVAP